MILDILNVIIVNKTHQEFNWTGMLDRTLGFVVEKRKTSHHTITTGWGFPPRWPTTIHSLLIPPECCHWDTFTRILIRGISHNSGCAWIEPDRDSDSVTELFPDLPCRSLITPKPPSMLLNRSTLCKFARSTYPNKTIIPDPRPISAFLSIALELSRVGGAPKFPLYKRQRNNIRHEYVHITASRKII